ncbi:SOH1 family protein [Russula ochroleuca]|uniref:Mediator of RNA polymerase II transcription subunit 31 n=1 Tax=Russula ochroleuca TaxID=152965 RepID=A0A9P5TC33_9AGAM|nr:SOH1 family protein [Russula ochroleuca]
MADSVKEGTEEERVKNRKRFELELEFVQALANPFYLHSLAQQGILYQPAFINYLKYLLYWKEKDYARFILYPHALHHLELLQHAEFRSEIMKDEWRERLNQTQFDHWRTWYVQYPPRYSSHAEHCLVSPGESRVISTRLLTVTRSRTVL